MYEERIYRELVSNKTKKTTLIIDESDLDIYYDNELKNADKELLKIRNIIKNHIKKESNFLTSLSPISINKKDNIFIKKMKKSSNLVNVGPMATVAGGVAEEIGKYLSNFNSEVLVENGGDIYINSKKNKNILIHAPTSPFSNKLYIKLRRELLPLGVCTSSGKLGHSLSFGNADAVVVISKNTFLADAAATSICNIVKEKKDIIKGINIAKNIKEILGIIIILNSDIGIWGDIEVKKV